VEVGAGLAQLLLGPLRGLLSSTQFSPRLLRNFLRDRPNQVVLSAFVATFAYSMAELYTVGVSSGNRTASFPGSR
jgi:uncharacterized membrane protein